MKIFDYKKYARWVLKIHSHFVAFVGDWFAADILQCPKHLSCSLDLMTTDFFLFPKIKGPQGGHPLTTYSPHNCLGWGHRHHRQRGVCRRLQKVV